MSIKRLLVVLCLCLGTFGYSQTRDDITVYLAPCTGGTTEQQAFFNENFKMEISAAGYALKDEERGADYTLKLNVQDNVIVYSDGTSDPDPDNPYLVTIVLDRNADRVEIVQFAFPFDSLEGMYQFNLYLVYQAMANVPLTKLTAIPDTNHWRNKWVYVRASVDYPITFYQISGDNVIVDSSSGSIRTINFDHKIMPYPAATLGAEFQFLNWMSAEGGFQLTFGDPMGMSFVPVIDLQLKFPLKPSRHFMIEPYLTGAFPLTTAANAIQFPKAGIGGGVQFGVKGGERGAFFFDMNFIYFVGQVEIKHTYGTNYTPPTLLYNRFVIGFGLGYKVGFYNRNKEDI